MQGHSMAVFRGVALSSLALLAACTGGMGAKDRTGEEQGELTPQQPPCAQLDEAACAADARCIPEYLACAAVCDADGTCPPCAGGFFACREAAPPPNPCAGLNEATCNQSPGCQSRYAEVCTACAETLLPCPEQGCTKSFAACEPIAPADPCANLPEALCLSPFCQPHYGEACMARYCEKPDGQSPEDCENLCAPTYAGCSSAVQGCASNCDCAPNQYCAIDSAPRPGEDACSPCAPGTECPPCPFTAPDAPKKISPPLGSCQPVPGQNGGGSVPPTDPAKDSPPSP